MKHKEELSRPDKKRSTPSSTFGWVGDEGDTFGEGGTLGSFTHTRMGGSIASTCACRGEAHPLMCGSVTTSTWLLADCKVKKFQVKKFQVTKLKVTKLKSEKVTMKMKINWHAPVHLTYIYERRLCDSVTNMKQNWHAPVDLTYIFLLRLSAEITYDTSFLNQKQLVVDGDVESI